MPLKEIFSMMSRSFCVVVTGIFSFFWIIGNYYTNNQYYATGELGRILVISFVAVLSLFILYSIQVKNLQVYKCEYV